MTIGLIVIRGAGDRPGDDIVDPLIGSIPVALERGRNELDSRASALQDLGAETVYRTDVRTGELGRFYNEQTGAIVTGKVGGITHEVRKVGESVQLTTRLRVKKPTLFYSP